MTTIKGLTNSEGLFTPINSAFYAEDRYQFALTHQPALCYNSDNQLVIGLNDVEVTGPVYWFMSISPANANKWFQCSEYAYSTQLEIRRRKGYLLISKADAQPVKEVEKCTNEYCEHGNVQIGDGVWQRCLVCNPANKRVKTVNAIISEMVDIMPFKMPSECIPYVKEAINTFHSQFATEAGGGKEDVISAAKRIAKIQDAKLPFETSRPIDNFLNGFFIGSEWREENYCRQRTHNLVYVEEVIKVEGKQSRDKIIYDLVKNWNLFDATDAIKLCEKVWDYAVKSKI